MWDRVNITLYTKALETDLLSHHPIHHILLVGQKTVNFSLFFHVNVDYN